MAEPQEATPIPHCMIDDMADIIASRQTVKFTLATDRVGCKAWVEILGPEGVAPITVRGLPGEWQGILAVAIKEWQDAQK